MWFIFGILAITLYLIYKFLTWDFNYWKNRGVIGPKPTVLLGNFRNDLLRQKHVAYDSREIYRTYKGKAPFVGVFQMHKPNLFVMDPELLKNIMIRNFKHFQNNGFAKLVNKEADPILGRNPFMLEDDEWRAKRSEITPAFTPNRIKALFPLINDVTGKMTKYIHSQLEKNDPFDARELCAKFTTDVVSNCIFAVDAESFTRENSEIRANGRRLTVPSLKIILSFILLSFFPFLKKIVNFPVVPKDLEQFFVNLMDQALKYREESKTDRDDYLGYLISLKKKKQIESIDMAAHAVSFFVDGFDTSSVAISNALYELGKNKRVQEKLREEIRQQNGAITFESINDMQYLDQVFNESLRKHPALVTLTRVCNEPIEIEGMKGKKFLVEKDLAIFIPVLEIHYDPENYEDPEKFNPERFDDGGIKDYKDRCVFLPFGDGPRICLGMRFALTQSKAAIVEILRNFEVIVNEKTQEPLILDPKEFLNVKAGGIWLDFKPIDKF